MNKKLSSALMLITTLILCCMCSPLSFAETTANTGSSAETTANVNSDSDDGAAQGAISDGGLSGAVQGALSDGGLSGAVQGALSDSGLSDAVNDVIGGIQDSGGISDVVGGISDRISGSISDYSSMLDGILNGGSQSQTTTSAQVTQSFGNFALPNSPVQNNTQNRVTSAPTTVYETTAPAAVPETTAPTTAAVPQTAAQNAEITAAGTSTTDKNESRGSGIWIFTAVVATIIMVVIVTLIAVTGHTEFNSRVYDKSTIKSVRKSSASEVEFDDDEPMDNIMYAGAADKDSHGSRG